MPVNDSLKYVLKTLGGIFLIFKIFLSLLVSIEYNLNCYWSTEVSFWMSILVFIMMIWGVLATGPNIKISNLSSFYELIIYS